MEEQRIYFQALVTRWVYFTKKSQYYLNLHPSLLSNHYDLFYRGLKILKLTFQTQIRFRQPPKVQGVCVVGGRDYSQE